MRRKKYSAGAVKHCFWFPEFRKMTELLQSGMSAEEIGNLNRSENIFGCSSPQRADMVFRVVLARIRALDPGFYPVFLNGDLNTQKLTALIAAMAHDALLFDFVNELIRDNLLTGRDEFTDSDIRAFFRNVQSRDANAAKWTEYTCGKLAGSYKTMLYEAGLTNKARFRRSVYRPVLEKELELWLKNQGLSDMIHALTGDE